MKKSMAVITAFIIGISFCSAETVVLAEQNEDYLKENTALFHVDEIELPQFSESNLRKKENMLLNGYLDSLKKDSDSLESNLEENEEQLPEKGVQEEARTSTQDPKSLLMPQKLEVVIDPWDVNGKGQIYSEQYTIQNAGEDTGILTLSDLVCRPREKSNVIVRTDKKGIHGGGEKSVYMEMVLGNGERIVLSEYGAEYSVELQPGEELSVCFAGEVNESASEEWEKADVSVGVVYSWETKENTDCIYEDEKEEVSDDQVDEEQISKEQDLVSADEAYEEPLFEETELPSETQEREEPYVVDLQMPMDMEFMVDAWSFEEEGEQLSAQCIFRNTGERDGVLSLSGLVCGMKEQNGIKIVPEPEMIYDSIEPCLYMEMIYGDEEEERFALSGEISEYERELKPGEEVVIRFAGKMSESISGNLKDQGVEVTAICSWNIQELKDK